MDLSQNLESELIPCIVVEDAKWPEHDPSAAMEEDTSGEGISTLQIESKKGGKQTVCEYVDKTHYSKKGCLVQFINTNCAGSSSVIGGIRLGLTEAEEIPSYISKWKQHLRLHGIKMLARHLIDTHCPTGAGETLFPED